MATDGSPPPTDVGGNSSAAEHPWRRWLRWLRQRLQAWGRQSLTTARSVGNTRWLQGMCQLPALVRAQADRLGLRRWQEWRYSRYFWPGLCLLQFLLLVVLLARKSPSTDSTTPAPATGPTTAVEVHPWPGGIPSSQRADELLAEGRFDLALAEYQRQAAPPGRVLPPPLLYRLALSLEGLGRWEEALTIYRQLAAQSDQPQVQAAMQVGQARILLRQGRPKEAKVLLAHLLLRAAEPHLENRPLLADLRYLLALTLAGEARLAEQAGPFTEAVLPFVGPDGNLERCLTWADPLPEAAARRLAKVREGVRLQSAGKAPEESLFTMVQTSAAVQPLLEQVGRLLHVRVVWSDQAGHVVAGQSVTLCLADCPLVDLLRILGDYLGLVWRLDKNLLYFQTGEEAGGETLLAYQRRSARRALREAILTHPNHPLLAGAYLELGNLDVADGKLTDAVAWYERILRESPRSLTGVRGSYNLGLVRRRLHDGAAAREAFFRVVDQAPTHELVPLAYLWIGHTYLEEAQPERAVPPLRRALGRAATPETAAALAVTLAAAQLLAGDPRAATVVLAEQRTHVSQPAYRPAAAFLDSLARFQLAQKKDRRQGQREATILLEALLAWGDDALLRAPGQLLRGQAYEELGLRDQAIRIYRQALRQARGPLANQLTYTLAEALRSANQPQQAKPLFLGLAQQERGRWAALAQYRLAEYALEEKQAQECLHWARRLLDQPATINERLILQVMGRAHELLGDYRSAAQCYAGKRPQ